MTEEQRLEYLHDRGPEFRDRFIDLAERFERETRNLSSPNAIAAHPSAQEIVALGKPVVPLILDRMNLYPWFWFDVLEKLTGENPIDPEMHGKMEDMTFAWVGWGWSEGLIPMNLP